MLLIVQYKEFLAFQSVVKSCEQYSPKVFFVLFYKLFLTFESVSVCSRTMQITFESHWAVLSRDGACDGVQYHSVLCVYLYKPSLFQIFFRNLSSGVKGEILKDGAYYCYCAYVLRISRYSGFLSVMLTNTGIFLRGLKLSGERGS